jgi:hypothetical protein
MKYYIVLGISLAALLSLFLSIGCGGSGASSSNHFSCMAQGPAGGPIGTTCEFYEATGADAAHVLDSLRAGCTSQGGLTLMVVNACPSANTLGGCKTKQLVMGGAAVQLYVTNFFYPSAGALGPSTTAQVQQQCAGENGMFVAAP